MYVRFRSLNLCNRIARPPSPSADSIRIAPCSCRSASLEKALFLFCPVYSAFFDRAPNLCLCAPPLLFCSSQKAVWRYEVVGDGVRFEYDSPDGEGGFPGALAVKVSYVYVRNREGGTEREMCTT